MTREILTQLESSDSLIIRCIMSLKSYASQTSVKTILRVLEGYANPLSSVLHSLSLSLSLSLSFTIISIVILMLSKSRLKT
jgi:hypothetical protein